MAKNSIEGRLSTVEANQKNAIERIDRLLPYMEKGELFRQDVTSKMATLINNQDMFKSYIVECESDRGSIKARTQSLEDSRTKQKYFAAGVSAVFTTIGAGLYAIYDHLFK